MKMLKHYLTTVFLTFSTVFLLAQAQDCPVEPSEIQLHYLESTRIARQAFDARAHQGRNGNNAISWVPIQIRDFIAGTGNYNYPIDDYTLNFYLNDLNETFLPYNVQFFQCSPIIRYDNPTLYWFDVSEEPQLTAYETPNVINIYFFGNVTNGSSTYCGYSYLPPSQDRIILSKSSSCGFDSDVLLHEMGHYLSLYHTHGKSNSVRTDELVDGTNCSYAGDEVCDTPADPNLFGSYGCVYTNTTIRDANNQIYSPDPSNLMSYAYYTCRNHFTPAQMNRMVYSLHHDRNYLNGCQHPGGCENTIRDYPYVSDFETGTENWYSGFGLSNFTFFPFQLNAGPTPTDSTGPDAAYSGNNYLYVESSIGAGPLAERYFILNSPCFDLRGLTAPELSFSYHAYGEDAGACYLQYSADGGYTWKGNPNFIWSTPGNLGNAWQRFQVDLSDFTHLPYLQFRFIGELGPGERGDIAIDSIALADLQPNGCTLSLVSSTFDIPCYGDPDGQISVDLLGAFTPPVSFNWSNGATDPAISGLLPGVYTLTVSDANGCSATGNFVINEPQDLQIQTTVSPESLPGQYNGQIFTTLAGGAPPYVYAWSTGATSSSLTGLTGGVYTVTVTDANGCAAEKSILVPSQGFTCNGFTSTFPNSNSFETNLGIFQQETVLDNRNWTRRSGSTPTANTGPSAAYQGNNYFYTEATGSQNSPNKTFMLKTTYCLDMAALSRPVFEFYYHMYGSQTGSLKVEISVNNGSTWQTVWSKSGNQGNQWQKASIDLFPYKSVYFKLRIVGTTGAGQLSDIAIDAYYFGGAGGNNYRGANENPVDFTGVPTDIQLYPNPAGDEIHLNLPENHAFHALKVLNQSGQVVQILEGLTPSDQTIRLALADLSAGTYFLRLIGAETSEVRRFVKLN